MSLFFRHSDSLSHLLCLYLDHHTSFLPSSLLSISSIPVIWCVFFLHTCQISSILMSLSVLIHHHQHHPIYLPLTYFLYYSSVTYILKSYQISYICSYSFFVAPNLVAITFLLHQVGQHCTQFNPPSVPTEETFFISPQSWVRYNGWEYCLSYQLSCITVAVVILFPCHFLNPCPKSP